MRTDQQNRTRTSVALVLAAFALVGALSAVRTFAIIPSAEEELARAYPPAMKGDLGACIDPAARAVPDTQADLAEFAAQLNGTWKVRSRTQQGISEEIQGRSRRLYFDLVPDGANRVAGAALLVDRPRQGTAPAADAAAGFWQMALSRNGNGRIALALRGESLGAYASVRASARQEHEFFELDGVFVSLFDDAVDASVWDRIVVSDSTLTYVACNEGIVERYVKVSDQKPQVEGASLQDYWRKLQSERKVARLRDAGVSAVAGAAGR